MSGVTQSETALLAWRGEDRTVQLIDDIQRVVRDFGMCSPHPHARALFLSRCTVCQISGEKRSKSGNTALSVALNTRAGHLDRRTCSQCEFARVSPRILGRDLKRTRQQTGH